MRDTFTKIFPSYKHSEPTCYINSMTHHNHYYPKKDDVGKKMQEIDGKLSVLSWKTSEGPKSSITQVKHIPNTMSKIRTYFSRAQVRSEGGKTFADVYIQHIVPMDDLRGDAEWFLKENKMGMYNKQLQHTTRLNRRI